jgi:hypothetical protein
LLQANGFDPWDYICLGTDFDGVIHPINLFLEEADLTELAVCLLQHLAHYYESPKCPISNSNKYFYPPSTILNKVMYENAQRFLKRWL